MENTLKREDFVRLRINQIEKERLLKIEKLTARKRSDIIREAMFRFIKEDYPEFINQS
jgi:predicted DNA-binding protein